MRTYNAMLSAGAYLDGSGAALDQITFGADPDQAILLEDGSHAERVDLVLCDYPPEDRLLAVKARPVSWRAPLTEDTVGCIYENDDGLILTNGAVAHFVGHEGECAGRTIKDMGVNKVHFKVDADTYHVDGCSFTNDSPLKSKPTLIYDTMALIGNLTCLSLMRTDNFREVISNARESGDPMIDVNFILDDPTREELLVSAHHLALRKDVILTEPVDPRGIPEELSELATLHPDWEFNLICGKGSDDDLCSTMARRRGSDDQWEAFGLEDSDDPLTVSPDVLGGAGEAAKSIARDALNRTYFEGEPNVEIKVHADGRNPIAAIVVEDGNWRNVESRWMVGSNRQSLSQTEDGEKNRHQGVSR